MCGAAHACSRWLGCGMSSTTGMSAIANPRIAVTRRIPQPALELLREHAELWVSPYDRPLGTDELHQAVAGVDVAVTLLHDRVDAACLDAAGAQLRCVAHVPVGYDKIDVPAPSRAAWARAPAGSARAGRGHGTCSSSWATAWRARRWG